MSWFLLVHTCLTYDICMSYPTINKDYYYYYYFFDLETFLLISGISGFSVFAIEHIRKPGIHGKFYCYCFLT